MRRLNSSFYILPLITFILSVSSVRATVPGEFSGQVSMDQRYYFEKGLYQNTDQSETVLSLAPEYAYSWDDDRKVLTFIPYATFSNLDSEKDHFDIREASFVTAYEQFEFKFGISKVFWGVTESQHLVDVVNQSDSVMNVDGEDKLGQAMVNMTYISDSGVFDFFILPLFRERTFSGKDGRFRTPLVVDTDNALYENSDEEKHIDLALRYSHTLGDLDLGLSIFEGTDRSPIFVLNSSGTKLLPKYIQTTQYGLDLQYIYESWIFKFEGIHKESKFTDNYSASTLGFEYTFSNVKSSGLDIGVLLEHLYDDRDKDQALFYNHSFIGSRLAFSDVSSTEVLAGVIINNENTKLSSLRLEGTRRINDNLKWELEVNALIDNKVTDQVNVFRKDDFVQLSLSYYL